eukprot:6169413-Ditylum_brightwellii.AAC.1
MPSQALPKEITEAQCETNNGKHHGHTMKDKGDNTLHIYFQNINGIAIEEDIKGYMEYINEKEVDIWGWDETNINWTQHPLAQAKYYGNKIFTDFTLVGSFNDDPAEF